MLFKYMNNFLWLLKNKTSEISYIIDPCSNEKMLLLESASTDFPETINTRVSPSFYFLKTVIRPFDTFLKCL